MNAPTTIKTSHRADFPGMFTPDGAPWHYLDTAATSQKPQAVLDAIMRGYGADYATVHRGVYARSADMTMAYEAARKRVAGFMGAASDSEIIFTSGATDSINLVAQSWGASNIKAGDRIMLSQLEHHSNIVPWQMLAERVGAHIDAAPLTDDERIDLDPLAARRLMLQAFIADSFVSVEDDTARETIETRALEALEGIL